eukprot:2322426-Prymnesium_polylepis.1
MPSCRAVMAAQCSVGLERVCGSRRPTSASLGSSSRRRRMLRPPRSDMHVEFARSRRVENASSGLPQRLRIAVLSSRDMKILANA